MITGTILPDALRHAHAANLQLGCGNFLHVAEAVSPYRDEQHFWMDVPVRIFTGETYKGFSLKELKHAVDTYASWYYGAGVRAKDPIAVYMDEGMGNLIHFLALNAIGAIPAIVNGNMPEETAAKWMEKVGAIGLYSDASHAEKIAPFIRGNRNLKFFVTDESAAEVYTPKLPEKYPFKHTDLDTVLIGHSSGTTGIPKCVAFGHQQFFYGIRYRLGLPFAPGSERVLSALPHSHSAGLAYVMLAVLSGSSTMVLSSNQPGVVLPAIQEFKPSMVVAFPETYVLLTDEPMEQYDLSSVRLWFNGGDAAHEPHIRKLIAEGHHLVNGEKVKGSVFIDGLGSSELGFSLFRNVHTATTENYNRCIGTALEWVDATVLSDDGEKLAPYQVGRLGVKSPSITPGYWNDSLLTIRSTLDGYFLTGDLAYVDSKGRFFHVDRVPDKIATSSGVVYSLETEELLLKHFEILSDVTVVAGVSGTGEANAIAAVRLRRGKTANEKSLLEAFNAKLKELGKNGLVEVRLVALDQIPLGPTGKVLKRELRNWLKPAAKPTVSSPVGAHYA